jgi:hypothetical protein
MESVSIYQDSLKELNQIKKSIANDTVTIHFNKMDANTRGVIVSAIQKAISERSGEITAVITGVK